jgi:hypothetical protein
VAESDRGVHPDLVDEQPEAAPEPEQRSNGRGRRNGNRSSAAPTPPPETVEASPQTGDDNVTTEGVEAAPDWREAWSKAATPEEAFSLLAKNISPDVLSKDETLSGFIGSRADKRARDLLRQQEQEAVERQKREAAANNDLYSLGELTAREYQQQALSNAQADPYQPMMDVINRVQQSLPENVQRDIAGKTYGEGKPWNEGLQEYLSSLIDSATKHRLSERESALRKSILSEINGSEPVPEREGGTPSRVRVVTDEQIAAMSLREFDGLFDENGHPRPGVQHRSTRGIPIQRS